MSFVDSTVQDIDARLGELRQEASQLEAARSALVGVTKAQTRNEGPKSPPKAGGRKGPGRPPGRSNTTRSEQALALVMSQPGITIPQIAESIGIDPNYLYRVMPKLASEGKVAKDGQGWTPVS